VDLDFSGFEFWISLAGIAKRHLTSHRNDILAAHIFRFCMSVWSVVGIENYLGDAVSIS
jgi:hypothetical protein